MLNQADAKVEALNLVVRTEAGDLLQPSVHLVDFGDELLEDAYELHILGLSHEAYQRCYGSVEILC